MLANFQAINLKKRPPQYYFATMVAMFVITTILCVAGTVAGLSTNRVRWFFLRGLAILIDTGILLVFFEYNMISLYNQAWDVLGKHTSADRRGTHTRANSPGASPRSSPQTTNRKMRYKAGSLRRGNNPNIGSERLSSGATQNSAMEFLDNVPMRSVPVSPRKAASERGGSEIGQPSFVARNSIEGTQSGVAFSPPLMQTPKPSDATGIPPLNLGATAQKSNPPISVTTDKGVTYMESPTSGGNGNSNVNIGSLKIAVTPGNQAESNSSFGGITPGTPSVQSSPPGSMGVEDAKEMRKKRLIKKAKGKNRVSGIPRESAVRKTRQSRLRSDIKEMKSGADSPRNSKLSTTKLSRTGSTRGLSRTGSTRGQRRRKKALGVLRRLLTTVVSAFLLGQICLLASAYVTYVWANSDLTVREYYAPDEFNIGQDIFQYATALIFGFFVYYSWIQTPPYLKAMWKCCCCQRNEDQDFPLPRETTF